MRLAIELAAKGEGSVEPNPMVGCVIVRDGQVIGQGYHNQFGGPHAEINALSSIGNDDAAGATAYVTLEPCSHVGKTGPCCDALIESEIARVVVACVDPNPLVGGQGIKRLRDAGITVETGLLESQARDLIAPYLKRIETGKPWVIAKWAMTLDGKIATATGDSRWISNAQSRSVVHELRGKVDAIMVGIGTALADDPMLNARLGEQADSAARPEEPDVKSVDNSNPLQRSPALRVVVDSMARISLDSKLVQSAKEIPTLIATSSESDSAKRQQLVELGCDVFTHDSADPNERLDALLIHLAQQQITNVLVEGGGQLLGSLNDLHQIDEVHCFIGPKITGGAGKTPVYGNGVELINDSTQIAIQSVEQLGEDVYIIGRRR